MSRRILPLILALTVAAGAFAAPLDPLRHALADLGPGIVYDRAVPLAALPELDGSAAAPVGPAPTGGAQALHELRLAAAPAAPSAWPTLAQVRETAAAGMQRRRPDSPGRARRRLRPPAGRRDRPRRPGGRGRPARGGAGRAGRRTTSPPARAFAATALVPRTYRGEDVVFVLPRSLYVDGEPRSRRAWTWTSTTASACATWRLDAPVAVRYASHGPAHAAPARDATRTAASSGAASPSRWRRCARRRRARPGRSPRTSRSRAPPPVRRGLRLPGRRPRGAHRPRGGDRGLRPGRQHGLGRAVRAAQPGEPARGPARAGPRRRDPELHVGHGPDPAQRLPRREAAADGAGRDRAGPHLPAGRREHGRPGGPLTRWRTWSTRRSRTA